MIFGILILAISLSIDSLGIGVAYGVREIKIPLNAKIIISILSFTFTSISIFFGGLVVKILPPVAAKSFGIIILMLMGVWIIYQALHEKETEKKPPDEEKTILNILIKSLGISIKIIHHPETCDMNKSSTIDPFEALYLGTALSIDSFGAGIGSAAVGLNSIFIPVAVALCQLIFLCTGLFIGKKIAVSKMIKVNNNIWSIISGSLLIVLGILRFL